MHDGWRVGEVLVGGWPAALQLECAQSLTWRYILRGSALPCGIPCQDQSPSVDEDNEMYRSTSALCRFGRCGSQGWDYQEGVF